MDSKIGAMYSYWCQFLYIVSAKTWSIKLSRGETSEGSINSKSKNVDVEVKKSFESKKSQFLWNLWEVLVWEQETFKRKVTFLFVF